MDKLSDFASYELGNIEGFDANIEAQIIGRAKQLERTNADLLEACEKVAAIVIDKYDACDTPLNEAWDACVKAIEKAKCPTES